MSPRLVIVLGALFAADGVLLGAYGAHGLSTQLQDAGFALEEAAARIAARWDPAVRYQMYHAIGLVLVGLVAGRRRGRSADLAAAMFVVGIVVFSGLLYVLTLTGDSWRWLGMVVPFGGVAFVVGWIAFAIAAWKGMSVVE